MGNPKGLRYLARAGFGVAPISRLYIDKITYRDACRQYKKDIEEDKNFDNESKVNFAVGTIFLSMKNWLFSLMHLSTLTGESPKVPKENLDGLNRSEIKENWTLVVEHFGLGVVKPPDAVLHARLRGYYGDPTLLDTDADGFPDKNVPAEVHNLDGSVHLISPSPDEPDIYVSPITVHKHTNDIDNTKSQQNNTKGAVEPSDMHFDPDPVYRSDDPQGKANEDAASDEPSDMHFDPDPVYRSDDPQGKTNDDVQPDQPQVPEIPNGQ